MANQPPKRRWYQFSLRTLLVAVTLVACACGWFAMKLNQGTRQRNAIRQLAKNHADQLNVHYDYQPWDDVPIATRIGEPPGPEWLRNLLGDDLFINVTGVSISHSTNLTDADAATIAENLPQLESLLNINPYQHQQYEPTLSNATGTPITDAGLAKLNSLSRLKFLFIPRASITDAGLQPLQKLTALELLNLEESPITGSGFAQLQTLKRLDFINVGSTRFSDENLRFLLPFENLTVLELEGTAVTSDGIKQLTGLKRLNRLGLAKTHIDDAAVRWLAEMPGLTQLDISYDKISDEACGHLESALPNCKIFGGYRDRHVPLPSPRTDLPAADPARRPTGYGPPR